MPAGTHQHGRSADPSDIIVLLSALLDTNAYELPKDTTLASLGLEHDPELWDLWDAVREEFGERSLGSIDGGEALDRSMTVEEAAVVMARLLNPAGEQDTPQHSGRPDAL